MKQIPLREFQLHPTKYLKELPLELTQYKNVVARLLPPEESVNSISKNKITKGTAVVVYPVIAPRPPKEILNQELENITTGRCQPDKAVCKGFGKQYKVTWMEDEGEVKEKRFLCSYHAKASRTPGVTVEEI